MDAREFLRTDVIVLVIVIYAAIGVAADLSRQTAGSGGCWPGIRNYAKDGGR